MRAPGAPPMPEVRIDPLTGFRAIVAGDRAHRPGGGLSATPPAPLDRESDPFAEGHEDRTPPELYAVRPGGGAPDTPGWTVRVVPNLYPALSDDSPTPEPDAKPDLFWAGPARGAHEVIINAPDPVTSLSDLTPEQVVAAVDVWRERMRSHERGGLRSPDRQRAARGRRLAPTHPRPAVRARLRAGGHRPRARAIRRLHDADDGRQPACRSRPGGGPPARADRGHRRRGGADGAIRGTGSVPADDRAADARGSGSRTTDRPEREWCTTR